MKRIALAAGLAACFGLFAAPAARGDDSILRHDPKAGKDVNISATIEEETPAGVKAKIGKDSQVIPPDEIVFIAYKANDVSEIEFKTPFGHEQLALEKMGDDRKNEYAQALMMYQALLKRVKGVPNAERFVQYRIAMVAVDQVKDDPTKRPAAIDALNSYRAANSGGWEIVPATKTVARLLEEGGDQDGARRAYEELAANAEVPKDIKLSTNLLVAKMLVRAKKFPDAEQKLKAVLADTADEKQKAYVQVYLAQTQVAQGNVKDAEAPLRAVLQATTDDNLKALAYNALGDFYQQSKQPEEAFWQYLRVDVLFNQDPEEDARALYSLWKLYDSVRSDPQRRGECLERLKDKRFAGTEYQARALKEAEEEKKAP
jgi:predicted negative regulator of RcsB-dependent stress response